MNKISTLTGRCIVILTILTLLSSFSSKADDPKPRLKFHNPQLVSGTSGKVGATYHFKNVFNNIDAYITIENIVGGAVLKDIDNTTTGSDDAWQPTVGGPGFGSSYIKWSVRFDSAGSPYVFSTLDISAIDVDGDNVRVREFNGMNGGQSNYTIPNQAPSLLTLSTVKDTDNTFGTDVSDSNLIALGPVANRKDIDTLSQDVRIDYHFTNRSSYKIYTGSQVDNNGNPGSISTNRFHCIYFGYVGGTLGLLPVTYQSFTAILNNNAVSLNWTTSAEVDNSYFEVERSFDEVNFSTAGIVLGALSVNKGVNQYSFKDNDPGIAGHKIIYYRLKQVDVDGNYTYSVVKVVRISNISNQTVAVQVMPNPYMDKLNVNFESQNEGKAEIRMISASGIIVKKMESTISKGSNTIQLGDLSSQLPGMYIINIIVNGQSVGSQKVIKN